MDVTAETWAILLPHKKFDNWVDGIAPEHYVKGLQPSTLSSLERTVYNSVTLFDDQTLEYMMCEGLYANLLTTTDAGYEVDLLSLADYEVQRPLDSLGARAILDQNCKLVSIELPAVNTVFRPDNASQSRGELFFYKGDNRTKGGGSSVAG